MNSSQLVLWDIDGTLMHCGSDGTKALNRTFFERFGIENAFERAHIGRAMDFAVLHGILKVFKIEAYELPDIIEHYREVLEEILNSNEDKRILPGVLPLLEAVDKHPLAVNALLTSNLRIGAETKLRSVGLDGFFILGGFGDEPGEKWHAAKRCIALAEERYHKVFAKENIVLIGDSCYDITCAKELGIRSIAVATGWAKTEDLVNAGPDHIFQDLSDTGKVLSVLGL